MNKIYTLILMAFLAIGLIACDDDNDPLPKDCDQVHIDQDLMGIPTVMKGSFPVGTLNPAVGDSVVFSPQLKDTTGVKYSWTLNGKEVSDDSAFTYKIEKPCRANVVCTLENPKGKVILKSEIVADYDLSKGIIVVQKGSVDLYDSETGRLYSDVYSALNYGDGLKLGSYDDLCVVPTSNKLYMVVSTSTSNVKHLYVADRKTLNAENSATIAANIAAFFLLNDKQALVTNGGVARIDLSSLSKTQLLKKYGWGIYNATVFNGKLLANTTYDDLTKVSYYNVDSLLIGKENNMPRATEIDIWQNSKVNFVKASNGKIYTLGCNEDATEYYIAEISADLSVQTTVLPFNPLLCGYSSGLYTTGLVLSQAGDAIYIPGEDNSIYKYTPGNAASLQTPLIAAPAGEETLSGAGVNVNPANGELWVCYVEEVDWNEYTGKIVVYNSSGKKVKSVDCGENAPQAVLFQ